MPEIMVLSFTTGLLIIVLALLWLRFRNQQLQHQERMGALEKGVAVLPAGVPPAGPRVYLLRGLVWSFVGAALTIALLGVGITAQTHPRRLPAEVLAHQAKSVAVDLGIPMDQAREMVNKDEAARVASSEGFPLALALFGLIPLGVGVAYLIFYRNHPSDQA